jgi:hypothetical protein
VHGKKRSANVNVCSVCRCGRGVQRHADNSDQLFQNTPISNKVVPVSVAPEVDRAGPSVCGGGGDNVCDRGRCQHALVHENYMLRAKLTRQHTHNRTLHSIQQSLRIPHYVKKLGMFSRSAKEGGKEGVSTSAGSTTVPTNITTTRSITQLCPPSPGGNCAGSYVEQEKPGASDDPPQGATSTGTPPGPRTRHAQHWLGRTGGGAGSASRAASERVPSGDKRTDCHAAVPRKEGGHGLCPASGKGEHPAGSHHQIPSRRGGNPAGEQGNAAAQDSPICDLPQRRGSVGGPPAASRLGRIPGSSGPPMAHEGGGKPEVVRRTTGGVRKVDTEGTCEPHPDQALTHPSSLLPGASLENTTVSGHGGGVGGRGGWVWSFCL